MGSVTTEAFPKCNASDLQSHTASKTETNPWNAQSIQRIALAHSAQ